MRRVLAFWLLFVSVALAQGQDQPSARRAFAEKFAAALSAKLGPNAVKVTADLEVTVKRDNGNTLTLPLHNRYADYVRDPSTFDAVIAGYLTSFAQPAPDKLDRTRIVPVIKDRRWLETNQSEVKGRSILHEPFVADLVIVFAEDSETRIRYLFTDEDTGVTGKDLRQLAIDNLAKILPKVEMARFDDSVAFITAGGHYEASLLLFGKMWSEQVKFDGDTVVAVPATNVLIATGSRNRSGLAAMRAVVAKVAGEDRRLISNTLLVYRNGRFVKFGR